MKMVGFDGGHSIYELGTSSDTEMFFKCLNEFAAKYFPERDWSVLTDRLYRRYLKQEEIEQAATLMNQAKQIFENVPSIKVNWKVELAADESGTRLNFNAPNLAGVFEKYFTNFVKAKDSAYSFLEAFKMYQPIRIMPTDLAGFATEKARPLQAYDALEGKPFWLQ